MSDINKLKEIVSQFIGDIENVTVEPLGKGHINDSFKVVDGYNEYVLQRINHYVFKNVDQLQDNIYRVTDHIRRKLKEQGVNDVDRRVLTLVPTSDDALYYRDGDGNYWRMTIYIKDSKSYEEINTDLAYRAGMAFGEFQKSLEDLPGAPLYETIPNFHNMETRIEAFRESVKANRAGRIDEVADLVNEIEKRAEEMCKAEKLHREGKLPKRINHCDTKVNNVLFDEHDQVLCVVDLDTVMPGYVLSDFGDFIRTGANTGAEDDKNLDNVSIDLDIFEAYAKGYLKHAASFLTDVEIENLAFGAKLLTYMQTVRFFTDYIDGDVYYKTAYPEHNLVRTKAQFKLLQSLEENYDEMQQIVQKAAGL
ncbi:MAG: aminoglycoside phosphotransferase family protein [Fermentimonas sp.]|jgi:Ser/Thr protein kinase RdoA (MazF antagonist)|nr:aminoglycoside phosphotransferase family protein [Fermentimonas sp.]MDD2931677.1 aminoglycoside phosphotransferase family protein [Fermentimonas sp.]MDD4285016.1 aminoglycoside phosphotransferase family protein [Fermentimonas sp.]MDD4698591.1 aminoglycoside phosphotransferase family protein [Fermentimonas sp.]NLC86787.1 aminoglycoside phosphotransferase family protein [Bacteroidales bacterium]